MAKLIPLPQKYPIPSNWKWVEMEKVVFTRSGFPFDSDKFSKEQEGRKPLIRIRDVVRGTTATYTDEKCPEEYIIHSGDVLIGMDGDFNVAKWQSEDALLNQRVCYICSASDALLNDYLFYYLPDPLKKINDATPSVTVKHLSTKTLEKTPVPLPPLPEQQRIVDRIESLFTKLDEAKEKAQAVVDGFEDRKAAILHKAFTGELTRSWRLDNGTNEKWDTVLFGSLIVDGPQNGLYKPKTAYGNGTKILRIDGFYDGNLEPWNTLKRLFLEENEMQIYLLRINDIVINRVNSMQFLGKSALIRELPEPCVFESNMMRISVDTTKAIPEYIIKYLNSSLGLKELRKNAKQAVNQASINQQDVKTVSIPLPSIREQMVIVSLIDSILGKDALVKTAAEHVIDQIGTMKKAILARAFRGELGTNDPAEESAERLLRVK